MADKEDIKTTQDKQSGQKPEKKSLIRRILKVVLYIVLILIGINVLLYALLSIPAVQQKVADFAVDKLKSSMNTEVSIDEVRLRLFNHAELKGIYVEDQAGDTLLYARSLDLSLSPWEFVKSRMITITSVNVDDFLINVNQKDSVSDFNFQFVIDAFSGPDSIPADTTAGAMAISIQDVNLSRGRVNYDVLSDSVTPGLFNASHIALYDVNANLDLNSIDTDNLDILLNSLSAKEITGLYVQNINGHLRSQNSQMWVEGLNLNLPNSHLIADNVRYNLDTDEFEIGTSDAEISPQDFISILPGMKFLQHNITLNTQISGTLPSVNIQSINITYGDEAVIEGNASISSYERYGIADISLFIDRFRVSPRAVTAFARVADSTFVSPDILQDVGNINLKGNLTGRLSDFKLNAEAWTRQGAVKAFAKGSVDSTFTDMSIIANLNTNSFNLGALLADTAGLGRISAQVDLRARQTENVPLSAQAQGRINSIEYNREAYRNIPFTAYCNSAEMGVTANADLPIGRVMARASMTQANVPDINVYLKVDTLHVDYFYTQPNWVNPRLSMVVDANIKGLDIDNMTGIANIDSLHLFDENFDFQPGKFTLEAGRNTNNNKFISITSSLLMANIEGEYVIMSLPDEFTNLMHKYLPAVFQQTRRVRRNQNDFTFNLSANNTEELGRILELPVNLIEPANISGRVNTIQDLITIQGNVPHIRYDVYDIKNTTLHIANADSAFNISLGSNVLMDNGLYRLALNIDGADNVMAARTNIYSENTNIKINGQIDAVAAFALGGQNELISTLNINPSDIMIDRLQLNLLPAEIINRGTRTEINNVGIGVNRKKYFGMDGVISELETDSLKAYFSQAQIGDLLEAFDIQNIRGNINGDILLTNILNQPELYTEDLRVADIIIFGDTLGTLNVGSYWSEEFGGVRLNTTLNKAGEDYAELDGTYYTAQDSLDMQLMMWEMPLKWAEPFATGMLNRLDGSISTNLIFQGSPTAPVMRGFLGFNDTQLGIDYTNVTYTISDTIRVSPGQIGFENLTLRDSQGNTASVNATVTHRNFADMRYALDMRMNNLMVLNTRHRTDSLFYGSVFASGNVRIDGDNDGINMNMQIRNDKNSNLNILLPQYSEASDYQSVVYINVPEDQLQASLDNPTNAIAEEPLPIRLNIGLDVTPDIVLGVIIDQASGDEMIARGTGRITFTYDMMNENMSAFGDYTLSDGTVKLNLQGLKRLDFRIQEGSKLFFIGDPMRTRFDITAYRRVRANLETLDSSFGQEGGSTRIDVDCILGISGNMDQMNITYDISLPTASDDVQQRVNSLISTDEQKVRNFASLVATGSFYSGTANMGSDFASGLWTGIASSALSAGLTSLVGNMLGDSWQIGANIDANDGSFSDVDMSVNVSRKFWDDRLTFSTNLGYRTQTATANDNAFIGDFDLEYKLNSMWTLRAYSHTNDQFYRQAPTTQGVGIVYSKEAATLKRLFQSFQPGRRRREARMNRLRLDSINAITRRDFINQPNAITPDIQTPRIEPRLPDSVPAASAQTVMPRQPMIYIKED